MPNATAPTLCIVPRCPRAAVARGRCPDHQRTTTERGYGTPHQLIRQVLAKTLPRRCDYGCGAVLARGSTWHAAHRVDGDPSKGYIVACVSCNERARRR